jgi:acyl-CoA thioesterase
LSGDLEEVPWAGDAFEFVFALVVEDEVGACEEIGDGARDEDLVRVGVGADALSDVHGVSPGTFGAPIVELHPVRELPRMETFDLLGIDLTDAARARVRVEPGLCAGDGRIFGGVLAASAGAIAARAVPDQPIVMLATQFLGAAGIGDELVLEHRTQEVRRMLTTSEIIGTVDDRAVYRASCIQVQPPSLPLTAMGPPMPDVASPSECPPRGYRWPDPVSISSWLDVRVAHLVASERRGRLWVRLDGVKQQRGAILAIAADHVAFVAQTMLEGDIRMLTLEQTLRLCPSHDVAAEWVLVEITLDAIDERVLHGNVLVWHAGGEIAALSQQTLLVTPARSI